MGVSRSAYEAARIVSVGLGAAGVAAGAALTEVNAVTAPSNPAIFLSIQILQNGGS
jgi:hypothetical protein